MYNKSSRYDQKLAKLVDKIFAKNPKNFKSQKRA